MGSGVAPQCSRNRCLARRTVWIPHVAAEAEQVERTLRRPAQGPHPRFLPYRIRQAITRAIAEQSRTIRIPVNMSELINQLGRAHRDLSQGLGREPLPEEIGSQLGIPADKVRQILKVSRGPCPSRNATAKTSRARRGIRE